MTTQGSAKDLLFIFKGACVLAIVFFLLFMFSLYNSLRVADTLIMGGVFIFYGTAAIMVYDKYEDKKEDEELEIEISKIK